jgi:fumarate hydratase subunit beta
VFNSKFALFGEIGVIESIQRGETPPFDLTDGAIWHLGPIARKVDEKWQIVAAGPTSSSRFTELGARLVEMRHVRFTIGKGTMGPPMVNALRKIGSVYLIATGGCAVLYAQQIADVENVHWLDLGMPEAIPPILL